MLRVWWKMPSDLLMAGPFAFAFSSVGALCGLPVNWLLSFRLPPLMVNKFRWVPFVRTRRFVCQSLRKDHMSVVGLPGIFGRSRYVKWNHASFTSVPAIYANRWEWWQTEIGNFYFRWYFSHFFRLASVPTSVKKIHILLERTPFGSHGRKSQAYSTGSGNGSLTVLCDSLF